MVRRLYFATPVALYAAGAVRVGMGLVLILCAPASRAPKILRALGAVMCMQALAATLLGPDRARAPRIFEHHRTATYVAKVREVRQLGADVVLVRAVVGMRPPGSAELNPAVNAIQSVVMTGQGASLRVALLHNTPAAFHGRPELAEALTRELTDVLHAGQVVSGATA